MEGKKGRKSEQLIFVTEQHEWYSNIELSLKSWCFIFSLKKVIFPAADWGFIYFYVRMNEIWLTTQLPTFFA